jgi:SEFIR domain-containing protein
VWIELAASVAPTPAAPRAGAVRAPRVFISYAHDSDVHREQVRNLWIFLRGHGVDTRIDRVGAEQRRDWPLWMERQVAEADRILIVASRAYKTRAGDEPDTEAGRGVQYEARLLRDLFYRNQADLDRFLPVVLPGGSIDDVPGFLTPAATTTY